MANGLNRSRGGALRQGAWSADYLKLDIQGYEFDAVLGSPENMNESVFT
jgi:hypothetical protein